MTLVAGSGAMGRAGNTTEARADYKTPRVARLAANWLLYLRLHGLSLGFWPQAHCPSNPGNLSMIPSVLVRDKTGAQRFRSEFVVGLIIPAYADGLALHGEPFDRLRAGSSNRR